MQIAPFLRGRISAQHRWIASFSDAPDVLQFIDSADAKELAFLGTSCPDHFIRTKIRPLFVPWEAGPTCSAEESHRYSLAEYREQYRAYYKAFATPDSPALRDASPTVVLIPGMGMFSFGKNKTEARITGEFYTNAIHVMEGASLLGEGEVPKGRCATVPAGNGSGELQGVLKLRGAAGYRGVSH
jgi:rhamnose utilization protein RhaD (predicted bifunctional aldolase and dehydrogenase)